MIKKDYRKIAGILFLVFFVAFLVVLFLFIDPTQLVEKIGVKNGYLLALVVSFFGGFSAGGSVSFISLLITLVAGGLNPLYLGLIAGVSLAIGDIIMFYMGSKGRELLTGKWDKKIENFARIFNEKAWLARSTPILAYLYMGFSPFPNDILLLSLVAVKYPIRNMIPVIILGDITFALSLTLLAEWGVMFFG